jgi:hypothetical protein
MMSRLGLVSAAAVSLTLLATPVLAQTFSDYNGNDTVATREQGNTAAVGTVGNPNVNGWNNGGIPIIGPLFGMATAPVAMATGNNWGQPQASCGLYHDFNGRYTSVCGL